MKQVPKRITIYTDGSCSPNPGPGGWGAVFVNERGICVRELYGSAGQATNNRMELYAALEALSTLNEPHDVCLSTDSQYLKNGITSWVQKWRENDWQTIDGEPVKNRDLWEALLRIVDVHKVEWRWVKGHGENLWNQRADDLAVEARKKQFQENTGLRDAVSLYTGVTWKNSTGKGNWATLLVYRNHHKILCGAENETTANMLYLVAVVEGIRAMKRNIPVLIYTKSGYLRDGLSQWLDGWSKREWKTREGNSISNCKLWQELHQLRKTFSLEVAPIDTEKTPCFLQEAKEIAREFE